MEGTHEPESFRSLLLRHRGRTCLIQRDLARRTGVSVRSVQDCEAGVIAQHYITRATRLVAEDGELGHVDRIAADADKGRLIASWVRGDGLCRHDMRIPNERVRLIDTHGNLHITDTRGGAQALPQ